MMCPIWPLHIILLYLLPLLVTYTAAKQWRSIEFSPSTLLQLHMGSSSTINFTIHNVTREDIEFGHLRLEFSDPTVLSAPSGEDLGELKHALSEEGSVVSQFKSQFDIRAQFLGYSDIRIKLKHEGLASVEDQGSLTSPPLKVTVVRQERLIDRLFTISVAALVSIIFVNFGCALDWPLLKASLKRPVAPAIGFVAQFLFMPVISFVLARLLFPHSVPLQLGLFFAGVAPGGGASNVWIYTLGGNINLSITMTAVSTFAAFGKLIFHLIVFIVIFAVYTNLYLFKLFTWKIVLAGAGLPWFGYMFGYLLARLTRQSPADTLAISVETGIQNTGIAIFMLRFSLGQPEADMTTVVPVAVALMTPLPLLAYYIYYKYQARICPSEIKNQPEIIQNHQEIVKFPVHDVSAPVSTISAPGVWNGLANGMKNGVGNGVINPNGLGNGVGNTAPNGVGNIVSNGTGHPNGVGNPVPIEEGRVANGVPQGAACPLRLIN
ncbi:uncharacterized protein LOC103513950 [Diaphorina citri]|uniref:Uncharacterized protein LOC103513950 n=1 Tax=Diaphorina citri TaxID=121845 RepID=A0A3Q0J802_DIACI|nr:uncharacterized protein LOC103513950 [Diaphorina citri]